MSLRPKSIAIMCQEKGYRIRCNSVAIETPMVQEAKGRVGQEQRVATGVLAAGSKGAPEDIANMILCLASDESRFVTGAEFVIENAVAIRAFCVRRSSTLPPMRQAFGVISGPRLGIGVVSIARQKDTRVIGHRHIIKKLNQSFGKLPDVIGKAIDVFVTKCAHHHLAVALEFRMAGDSAGSPSFTKVGQVNPMVVSVMSARAKDGKSLLVHLYDCIEAGRYHFTISGSDFSISREKCGNSLQFSIIDIERIARHQSTDIGFGF